MAAAVSIAQTFDRLLRPVRIPADETWIAPATLDRALAATRLRALVHPHLAHRDDREEVANRLSPRLLYVPFWRVKLAVPAIHLTPSARNIAIANIEFPMPTLCYGGRAGVLMICARSAIPYTPRLPPFFGGTDALEVQRSDLLPMTNTRAVSILTGEEIVQADVEREQGEQIAKDTLAEMLARPAPPRSARSIFLPRVESTVFVRYPVYYARIGDADEHYVLFSARDGEVVSARYPRAPTISERVKRFFNR